MKFKKSILALGTLGSMGLALSTTIACTNNDNQLNDYQYNADAEASNLPTIKAKKGYKIARSQIETTLDGVYSKGVLNIDANQFDPNTDLAKQNERNLKIMRDAELAFDVDTSDLEIASSQREWKESLNLFAEGQANLITQVTFTNGLVATYDLTINVKAINPEVAVDETSAIEGDYVQTITHGDHSEGVLFLDKKADIEDLSKKEFENKLLTQEIEKLFNVNDESFASASKTLTWIDSLDAYTNGEYQVLYQIKNDDQTLDYLLTVKVRDDAPYITANNTKDVYGKKIQTLKGGSHAKGELAFKLWDKDTSSTMELYNRLHKNAFEEMFTVHDQGQEIKSVDRRWENEFDGYSVGTYHYIYQVTFADYSVATYDFNVYVESVFSDKPYINLDTTTPVSGSYASLFTPGQKSVGVIWIKGWDNPGSEEEQDFQNRLIMKQLEDLLSLRSYGQVIDEIKMDWIQPVNIYQKDDYELFYSAKLGDRIAASLDLNIHVN